MRDISNQAKINRATFYRHCQDKFDLVDQYVQEAYHLFDVPSGASPVPIDLNNMEAPHPGLVRLFEHIRENAKFFRVMLGKNGDPGFVERVRQHIQKRLRSWLPQAMSDDTAAEPYLSYASAGALGLILWWLEYDAPYSPAEIATLALRLSAAGQCAAVGSVNRHS